MPHGNNKAIDGVVNLPIKFHLIEEDAIIQNSYWERRFALYYKDEFGVKTLWDLASSMVGGFASVRPTPNNEQPHILFLHTSNGGVVLGPTGSEPENQFSFKLIVQQSDTSSLDDIGKCHWDIYVLTGSGQHLYLYRGDAALERNIT